MDLSNLSNTLPSTNPSATTTPTSSQGNLSHELTNHFKDAAKSVAALYNASLNHNHSNNTNNDKLVKTEFANAAKSVASLYKLSQSAHHTAHNKGYLQCLEDILSVLANDEDVEDWVLTKRIDLLNQGHSKQQSTSDSTNLASQSEPISLSDSEDFTIPQDYEFSFNLDIRPPTSFRASIPPISVQHTGKQRLAINNPHSRHNKKFILSDDAIIEDLSESEEKELKQHQKYFNESPLKKKKKFN